MPNQLEVTYHKKVGALHRHGGIVRVGIQEGATQVVRHRHQMGRLHFTGRLGLLTILPLMMLVPPSLTDPLRSTPTMSTATPTMDMTVSVIYHRQVGMLIRSGVIYHRQVGMLR
jgi:hypothetical protein